MKKIIITVLVLAALVAGGLVALPRIASAQTSRSTTAYQTTTAALGDITNSVSGTGNVRARQTSTIKWQVTGSVAKVNVAKGDSVAAGAVLAELDMSSVPTSLLSAQVDLQTAQKNLESVLDNTAARAAAQVALINAKDALKDAEDTTNAATYQRASQNTIDIYKSKLITANVALSRAEDAMYALTHSNRPNPNYDSDYANALSTLAYARDAVETAKYNLSYVEGLPGVNNVALVNAELDQARANLAAAQKAYDLVKDGPNPTEVAAAEAKVAVAQATLNQAKIVAPFAGIVADVYSEVGDTVSSSTTAFILQDQSRFLVDVSISEIDIAKVKVGQPASLAFDAILKQTYTGTVTKIASTGTTSSGSVYFTVTVAMNDADASVKAGMSATVDIVVEKISGVLLVPTSAIKTTNGTSIVYVLQNNAAVPLTITLGSASDTSTQVAGGDLKAGDLVITNYSTVSKTTSTTSSSGLSGLLQMFTGGAATTGGAPSGGGPGGVPPSGGPPSGGPGGGGTSSSGG